MTRTMNEKKRLSYDLLLAIKKSGEPLGALYLSNMLNIPSATVGRLLNDLEYCSYLKKISNKGRVLTQKGEDYLNQLADELMMQESAWELYRMSQCSEKKTVLDMLYARRTVEIAVVELAAERITEKEVQELEHLVEERSKGKAVEQNSDDIEFDFHLAIARFSGNHSYEQILKLLLSKTTDKGNLVALARAATHMPNYYHHSAIISALRSHDQSLAKDLMKNHIDAYIDYIDKNL